MMRRLLLLVFVMLGCKSPDHLNVLFDASALAARPSPETVQEIMKMKPDSAFYKTLFGVEKFILLYNVKDSTEFRFQDNKLEEVIVNKPSMAYHPKSIAFFGLPLVQPTEVDTAAYFLWRNVFAGMEVVNFYKVGSRPDDRTMRYKVYFKLAL